MTQNHSRPVGLVAAATDTSEATTTSTSSLDTEPRLRVSGVSKTFAGQRALSDFALTIRPGEVHALVGENGSGKSTFIKVLAGFYTPDSGGEIFIDGQKLRSGSAQAAYHAGCRFVHQDLALVDSASIRDNLSFGNGFSCRLGTVDPRANRRRAEEDLQRVGLDIDPSTPVSALTAAVRTGVAVARALRSQPGKGQARLLVLDEPTATLPNSEVQQLLSIIRSVAASGVSVLYVTHRLDEIFDIGSNVSVLRDGVKVAERTVASLNRKELVSILVGTEFDDIHAAASALPPHERGTILEVQSALAPTLDSVSFNVAPGEIVGIAGITGSGRETLLAALFGSVPLASGTVAVNGKKVPPGRPHASIAAGMAFLPADRKNLSAVMNLSARENLTVAMLAPFWRRGLLNRRAERAEVRRWFDQLSIRPSAGADRPLATFSGGNQQKVLFAKWLRREPQVLLLDEPTQGVDVGAKAELHKQVLAAAAREAAVVVSSSDADELAALCQRVLVMRNGRIVADLRGPNVTVANLARESLGIEHGRSLAL